MSATQKKNEQYYQKTLQEEFKKILAFYKRAEAKEPIDLKEMLKTYLHLFVLINESMAKGGEKEKKEALWILSEFFTFYQAEASKIRQKTGLPENELFAAVDNPNFFTQEQWKAIQETKQEMNRMGLTLSDLLIKKVGK